MDDWLVNLIIGLTGTILGFLGGFLTKSINIKNKQKSKGINNKQQIQIGDVTNGK